MWPVQKKLLAILAIIEYNAKTPGGRDQKLLKLSMRVSPTNGAGGHIIKVVNATNSKRNMSVPFNKCQITSTVRNLRKIDDSSGALRYSRNCTSVMRT